MSETKAQFVIRDADMNERQDMHSIDIRSVSFQENTNILYSIELN